MITPAQVAASQRLQACEQAGCSVGWVRGLAGVSRCPACKGTGLKLNLLRVVTGDALPKTNFTRKPVFRKSVLP